jgi:hypothetical protein
MGRIWPSGRPGRRAMTGRGRRRIAHRRPGYAQDCAHRYAAPTPRRTLKAWRRTTSAPPEVNRPWRRGPRQGSCSSISGTGRSACPGSVHGWAEGSGLHRRSSPAPARSMHRDGGTASASLPRRQSAQLRCRRCRPSRCA